MTFREQQELIELGDRLETAIRGELRLNGPHSSNSRSTRRRRMPALLLATAAAIGLGVAAVAVWPDRADQITMVNTAAGPAVQLPMDANVMDAPPDLSAEQFAHQVFAHLPPSRDSHVTCTTSMPSRYTCTVDPSTTQPPPGGGAIRLLFVSPDHDRLRSGACISQHDSPSTWQCALADAALTDGLLSLPELDALLSDN
jgi:hypothetical protein